MANRRPQADGGEASPLLCQQHGSRRGRMRWCQRRRDWGVWAWDPDAHSQARPSLRKGPRPRPRAVCQKQIEEASPVAKSDTDFDDGSAARQRRSRATSKFGAALSKCVRPDQAYTAGPLLALWMLVPRDGLRTRDRPPVAATDGASRRSRDFCHPGSKFLNLSSAALARSGGSSSSEDPGSTAKRWSIRGDWRNRCSGRSHCNAIDHGG